jgi:uncharacterized protein DUF2867
MEPWGRATEAQYRSRDLIAHELLRGIPVHDVWRVFLPNTGRSCSMIEVRRVAQALTRTKRKGVVIPALFAVRRVLGSLLGWDEVESEDWVSAVSARMLPELRRRSLVPVGTQDGPFRVVYVVAEEALSEIRNATVEAYLVWSIRPTTGGTELLWAIHVVPVGAWTRPYLAAIAPFRRFLVYPGLLHRFHEEWKRGAEVSAT